MYQLAKRESSLENLREEKARKEVQGATFQPNIHKLRKKVRSPKRELPTQPSQQEINQVFIQNRQKEIWSILKDKIKTIFSESNEEIIKRISSKRRASYFAGQFINEEIKAKKDINDQEQEDKPGFTNWDQSSQSITTNKEFDES